MWVPEDLFNSVGIDLAGRKPVGGHHHVVEVVVERQGTGSTHVGVNVLPAVQN